MSTPATSENPLVSVILTSYNYEEFIVDAIKSVFAQKYRPMELILVDDGSTDGSVKVIQETIASSPIPVNTIFQKNGGQANAWNNAYKKVKGEIVCFLDSDDYWIEIKVWEMVRFMLVTPGGGVYQHQLENGKGEFKQRYLNSGDYFADWTNMRRINVSSKQGSISPCVPSTGLMFWKEVLDKIFPIPEELTTCPDAFLTRTAPAFGPIYSHPATLGYWREHEDNAGKQETYGYLEFWIPVIMPLLNEWYREHDIPIELYYKKRSLIKEGLRHYTDDSGKFWHYFKKWFGKKISKK